METSYEEYEHILDTFNDIRKMFVRVTNDATNKMFNEVYKYLLLTGDINMLCRYCDKRDEERQKHTPQYIIEV